MIDIALYLEEHSIPEPNSGCLLWTGWYTSDGYGGIGINYKKYKAHRISWESIHGKIDDNMHVLHKCDNPACINVDHLYLGTPKDNSDDRGRRQRQDSYLTEDDVRAIRKDTRIQRIIAEDYNITQANVSYIKLRKGWIHVTD